MAKKFVRGITDINEINKQDFDTNNVNDLLSDGEHNYIHRKKKDNSEEYHNLTNNLKTITSDNTDLISVTNYNNSTNTATLHPKHDTQKEQTIGSVRNTINIEHGENGTSETTKVDTNPAKVLEHDNLLAGDNLTKTHSGNTTTFKVSDDFTQRVTSAENNITDLQNNKQNKLTKNLSIGVLDNNTLKQLLYYNKTYAVGASFLKTFAKSIGLASNVNIELTEYSFSLRVAQGLNQVVFNLNETDFNLMKEVVGLNRTTNISGCLCTLDETNLTLTVTTTHNTDGNYIIYSSTII